MKKNKIKYLLFVIFALFLCINPVMAATEHPTAICLKSDVVLVARIIGYALFLVKLAVPILLIGLGSVDLGKAVLSSDDNAIKASISILIKRAIAGVVIFFIPSLLTFVMSLIDDANKLSDFNCITDCIKNPKSCTIPTTNGVLEDTENEENK